MKSKKRYIKDKANSQIVRLSLMIKVLIGIMGLIVVYDSIVHQTPLYYIAYFFVGLLVGKIFSFTQKVDGYVDIGEFSLISTKWNVLLILVLIMLRFVLGSWILDKMHVAWPADALYLFFIGLYRSRWKSIVNQIDERVYQFFAKNKS